ncbi:hypothetical protein QFZ94_005021 [Paraburkholderia sp. JPY465]|uniref:hypothetical protein n=1 Tax=Paraburkholderia sp. JPY465 TaxID=3042285 RepID=UPI003D1FD686
MLEALLDQDTELLGDVFARYFPGCLAQFGKLQSNDGPDWQVTQNLRLAVAPVLDLMEVSGYALLLSEYHGNRALWSIVRATWERHLTDSRRLAGIVALVNFIESGFGAKPRDILRMRWQRRVEGKLEQLPREPVKDESWYIASKTKAVHASPLVRAMASRAHSLSFEGIDLFVGLYLARKPGAESLSKYWKRSSLADELADEHYDIDTPDDEEKSK